MGIPHLEEKGRLGSGLARTVIKMHPDSGAVCQPSVGPERSECSEAKVTTTPLVPSRCSGVAVALAESQFIESRDVLAVRGVFQRAGGSCQSCRASCHRTEELLRKTRPRDPQLSQPTPSSNLFQNRQTAVDLIALFLLTRLLSVGRTGVLKGR